MKADKATNEYKNMQDCKAKITPVYVRELSCAKKDRKHLKLPKNAVVVGNLCFYSESPLDNTRISALLRHMVLTRCPLLPKMKPKSSP